MTTGTFTLPGGYPQATPYQYKNWVGSDGREEIVNGKKRIRYNNYNVTITRESPLIPSVPLVFCTAGGNLPGGNVLLPWTSQDEFQLQSRLATAVKGHEFNLAVNLAQSKQLVDMVVDNVRRFSRSLRALKRGDIASATRYLGTTSNRDPKLKAKDISGRWLELQYGWLPALSDTFEAAKAYEQITNMRNTRVVAKLKKKPFPYEGSAAPSNYLAPGTAKTGKRIIYEMEEALSAPRTLGLLDPLSVVWEIIPYSFVIDWFLPIGSYLENLAIIPNLRGRFVSTLSQEKSAAVKQAINPTYSGRRRVYFHRVVSRVCTTGLMTARPSFNSPIVALSAKRIFNAISLGHQRLK